MSDVVIRSIRFFLVDDLFLALQSVAAMWE